MENRKAPHTRRIQLTGGSTHVISLPKRWIDRSQLAPKDPLEIHEEPDGSLLIAPARQIQMRGKPRYLDLTDIRSADRVTRMLIGCYLAGADIIHLRSKGGFTPEAYDAIQTLIRDLVGVEVQDESTDSLVLQDLVGVSELDFKRTIGRMHRIGRIMLDEALQVIDQLDDQLAERVSKRDDEVDRIEWMITKQMHALLEQPRLAANLDVRPAEALNWFVVARTTERISDHASKMARTARTLIARNASWDAVPSGANVVQSLITQAAAVSEMWDQAFQSMKTSNFDQANDAVDAAKKLNQWKTQFAGLLLELPSSMAGPLTVIADSIDRIRAYAIDIAETAMNQTFHADES